MTHKSHISIWDYGLREAIQLKDLFKIEFSNSKGICDFSIRNVMDLQPLKVKENDLIDKN